MMEEWYVPGTDSESEPTKEESETSYLEFGGIKIPPSRLFDLVQTIQQKKTVELDGLNEEYHRRRQHRKKKKKKEKEKSKKRASASAMGVGGANKSLEETSESASEIRSTTCTSTTATECRDMRKPSLHMFDDPELDDDIGSPMISLPKRKKKAPPPPSHRKENQLARLDKITADEWKRKQRWQQVQRDTHDHTDQNFASSKEHFFQIEPTNQMNDSMSMEEEVEEQENMEVANNSGRFTFDDADSDGESSQSDSDMKTSLLSQLNKVEQLLDFEVS